MEPGMWLLVSNAAFAAMPPMECPTITVDTGVAIPAPKAGTKPGIALKTRSCYDEANKPKAGTKPGIALKT